MLPTNTLDGDCTMLAADLNRAMGADLEAQARYLAIYGERWVPLTDRDGFVAGTGNKITEASYRGTVPCR